MNNRTANAMPKPLLRYIGDGKFKMTEDLGMDDSAMTHWLFQDLGETYRLQWFGSGWIVFFQESYLTKDFHFTHKNDIPGFDYSHFPFVEAEKWQHIFETRNDAVDAFKVHYCKLRGIEPSTDKRLYDEKLPSDVHLMTIKDWNEAVKYGMIMDDDGCGYWVKDGLESRDEVFSTEQLDATHVAWYNK